MQITRQADYAVRAVQHLAQLGPGERAATARIALEQKIPPTFLAKIVSQLSVAGILQASRGARGGVALGRPADEISLLEVVEAIDGPVLLNECVLDPSQCPMGDTCAVRDVWCGAQAVLVRRLEEATFGALARASSQPAAVSAPASGNGRSF